MIDLGLARAQAGDEEAFRELTEPLQRELQLHCYRILGSVQDAEDMVQESLLAAWRGLARFERRASVRAWLYRIATNRCLNALRDRSRRPLEQLPDPPFEPPAPSHWDEPIWLEPYPDALIGELADAAPGPEARWEARETIELAFIAALQNLTPRQRAVLLLREVLGYRTEEVASMLETSPASVKGALQRARATLETRLPSGERHRAPLPHSERERVLAMRFADAFERDDVDELVDLVTDEARLSMPPYPHAYHGREAIGKFLRASAGWRGTRRFRLVPTRANSQPAFGCYLQDSPGATAQAAGLIVLTLDNDRLSRITRFVDATVFRHFGLPLTLS